MLSTIGDRLQRLWRLPPIAWGELEVDGRCRWLISTLLVARVHVGAGVAPAAPAPASAPSPSTSSLSFSASIRGAACLLCKLVLQPQRAIEQVMRRPRRGSGLLPPVICSAAVRSSTRGARRSQAPGWAGGARAPACVYVAGSSSARVVVVVRASGPCLWQSLRPRRTWRAPAAWSGAARHRHRHAHQAGCDVAIGKHVVQDARAPLKAPLKFWDLLPETNIPEDLKQSVDRLFPTPGGGGGACWMAQPPPGYILSFCYL